MLAAACGDNDVAGDGDDGDDGDDGTGADAGPGDQACTPDALPGPLSEAEWDPRFTIAGITGQDGLTPKVFGLAREADGDLLATGYFQWLGTDRVEPLLTRGDDGWQPARAKWELPVPAAGFSAVASGPGGELALATYDALGTRASEIWVDRGDGLEVVASVRGLVRALAWFDGELWAGGNYNLTQGGAPGLSVWNGTTWSAPPGGAASGPVYELVQLGDSLFVGGDFASIGGTAARRVAEWNGTDWTAFDLPNFGLGVYAIARGTDGTLYAGGAFSDSDEPGGSGGVAQWTGTEWQVLGGGLANEFFGGVATDLEVHLGELYVTGCFAYAAGGPEDPGAIQAQSLARWTGSEWQAIDPGPGAATVWHEFAACGDEGPDAIWDVPHQRLLSDGELLYLGGSISGAGEVSSQSIVALSGDDWIAQGAAGLGTAGEVRDLGIGGDDCGLLAVGRISHAGGEPMTSGIARFDGEWSAVGPSLPPFLFCVGQAITEEGDIYVGCYDQASDVLASHVYRLVDGEWEAVGEPHGLESIQDLAVDGAGRLWVVGGLATGYVARLDGDQFTVVEDGFDALVSRIAIARGDDEQPAIVVGGNFTRIGETEAVRVARFDGAEWTALGDGVNTSVMALEYGADAIYVATADEGVPGRRVLAAWDGAAWTELATPERGLAAPIGESSHTFTALREIGGDLIAVGFVWPETGGRNAFLYDGERFTDIAGGIAAISVDSIAVGRDGIWFGGTIAEVGGSSALPSVGIAHLVWPGR